MDNNNISPQTKKSWWKKVGKSVTLLLRYIAEGIPGLVFINGSFQVIKDAVKPKNAIPASQMNRLTFKQAMSLKYWLVKYKDDNEEKIEKMNNISKEVANRLKSGELINEQDLNMDSKTDDQLDELDALLNSLDYMEDEEEEVEENEDMDQPDEMSTGENLLITIDRNEVVAFSEEADMSDYGVTDKGLIRSVISYTGRDFIYKLLLKMFDASMKVVSFTANIVKGVTPKILHVLGVSTLKVSKFCINKVNSNLKVANERKARIKYANTVKGNIYSQKSIRKVELNKRGISIIKAFKEYEFNLKSLHEIISKGFRSTRSGNVDVYALTIPETLERVQIYLKKLDKEIPDIDYANKNLNKLVEIIKSKNNSREKIKIVLNYYFDYTKETTKVTNSAIFIKDYYEKYIDDYELVNKKILCIHEDVEVIANWLKTLDKSHTLTQEQKDLARSIASDMRQYYVQKVSKYMDELELHRKCMDTLLDAASYADKIYISGNEEGDNDD